jgi:hypothetical protein
MSSEQPSHASTAYAPRAHQQAIHADAARFKVLVCHRRFGKTVLAINALIDAAVATRIPDARFAYIAPSALQVKRVAWDYLKRFAATVDEARFDPALLAAAEATQAPEAARRRARIAKARASETELSIDFANGARIQLHGADEPDSLRGIYLDGVVFDEYGQMRPAMWSEVARPMLVDRAGFAIFIGTPKGQNGFFDLWRNAEGRPGWSRVLHKASDTGLIPAPELAAARRDMSAEEYEQEFECSFAAAIVGAYFGRDITQAEADGRLTELPHDPRHPVYTAWDLGYNDPTAIWFVQLVGGEVRWIDYHEERGRGLDHYALLVRRKGFRYAAHYLPHDIEAHDIGPGSVRREILERHGLGPLRVVPRLPVEDGIEALRDVLRSSVFDEARCKTGIEALRHYRAEWNQARGAFIRQPLHDWASHAADAARQLALGLRDRPRWGASSNESSVDAGYDVMRE